ncbi:hypothetical protein ASD86_06565 [Lysobacter sp. Root690]|nr:hypothetical protein ASD86_06565 [Lysobacter sp. Root690]
MGSHENGYLSLWLADTLKEHRFAKDSAPQIAAHLRGIADAIKNAGADSWRARDYYGAAGEWYKVGRDDLNESAMTVAVAESFYDEAKSRIEGAHPSYMAAASFLEDAILVFRRVPGSHRAAHGVDERIEQLQRELREAGEKSHAEMATISSGPIDVLDLVAHAEQSVTGKSFVEALGGLASLFNISDYQKSKDQAKAALCAHPLMSSMHASVLGRDGNVVAKRPGFNMAEPDSEANEAAIRAQMIQTQAQAMGLRVQALILPALEIVQLEHGVKLQALIQFASQTSIVPPGRERLVAQGLHYGFEGNWAAAVHLLVPQLEHLVRYHIKQNGAITTVMSKEGVVNEVGLSGLMTLPEVESFFGPNYSFEIRALFCDHYGPNLRNELAHGLLSDREAFSAESVYAWWFMFMLVMTGWRHELRGRIAQAKAGDPQAGPVAAGGEGAAAPAEALAP